LLNDGEVPAEGVDQLLDLARFAGAGDLVLNGQEVAVDERLAASEYDCRKLMLKTLKTLRTSCWMLETRSMARRKTPP
jgi:hypothetical protein